MSKQNFYHCEKCEHITTHNLKEGIVVDKKLIEEVLEFLRYSGDNYWSDCGYRLNEDNEDFDKIKSKLEELLR